MFFLIDYILEVLSELLLQLLFGLGIRRVADIFNKPVLAAIIFGVISGFVSLLFFDEIFVSHPALKIANLIISPILLGFSMAFVGKFYKKLGVIHSSIDNFISGFCFGLAMILVRYIFSS